MTHKKCTCHAIPTIQEAAAFDKLQWTQQVPTIEGYYLRYNIRVTLHYLKDMRAEFPDWAEGLFVSWGEGLKHVGSLDTFWWYGPIPQHPEEK